MDFVDAALLGLYGGMCNIILRLAADKYSIPWMKGMFPGLFVTIMGAVIYAKIGATASISITSAAVIGVFREDIRRFFGDIASK